MRRPTLDESNRIFTAVVVGLGGVVGSGISFLVSGAGLAAIWRLHQGKIALPQDGRVLAIGGAFACYALAEWLSALVNFSEAAALLDLLATLPFLGFLLIYSRLSLSNRRDILRAVDIGVIVGSIGAFAFALIQLGLFDLPRARGGAGNPGPFALLCAVLYGLSIQTALRTDGRVRRYAWLAAAAAGGALALAGMRSLWPMLLIAPLVPLAVFRSRLANLNLRKTAIAVAVFALAIGILGSAVIQTRVQGLFRDFASVTNDANFDNSLGLRLTMWSDGLEIAAQKPLLGHGPRGATVELPGNETRSFNHYHNAAVTALVRTGVLGLLAVLSMFAVPLWLAARAERDKVADAGLAMMLTVSVTYLFFGIFNIMLGHDILDALFIYCMIVASYLVFGPGNRAEKHVDGPPGSYADLPPAQPGAPDNSHAHTQRLHERPPALSWQIQMRPENWMQQVRS